MPTHSVSREQVLAFRLQEHHLSERLPAGSLVEAAEAGIQNTPPGSGLLAFHARLEAFTRAGLERALAVDKALLQIWCMRASPYFVPTRAAAVFTAGLLPDDDEALRYLLRGAVEHLHRFDMSASQAVIRTSQALAGVLDGRELDKDQLGFELAARLEPYVDPDRLELWRQPDGMTRYGESLARYALNVVALSGLFCIAPRRANRTTFLRSDQWLGAPPPRLDPPAARVALLRRYLAAYGPSTSGDFAIWCGASPAQTARTWQLAAAELEPVDFDGRPTWLWRADLARLENPPRPRGVRLLPPHDPYLAQSDRASLLPEKQLHRLFWRPSGNPGAVLIDGEIVAAWRARVKGQRLEFELQPIAPLAPPARPTIEAELAQIADLRQCRNWVVDGGW